MVIDERTAAAERRVDTLLDALGAAIADIKLALYLHRRSDKGTCVTCVNEPHPCSTARALGAVAAPPVRRRWLR